MGGIEVKDLVFTYPGTSSETLRGVDLTVGEGEFLSLIGPSGCGKSTLLRLLAGLERPESGSLFCGGVLITGPGSDRGVVFQSPALFPWMTARDNVSFAIRKSEHLLSRAEARSRAGGAVPCWACRFHEHAAKPAFRRHAAARCYCKSARYGLSYAAVGRAVFCAGPQNRFALQELLLKLWEEDRKTVLFVTHDMDEAILLGDRVAFMESGRIVFRHKIPFFTPAPAKRCLFPASAARCGGDMISLFYKWGEAAEVNP